MLKRPNVDIHLQEDFIPDAVLLLLFGLLRSGQITLRTLDGYQHMKEVEKAA